MLEFASKVMLAWLAVMAIPVVIHLLHRRRHRTIDWGAMKFLLESMGQQSKRVRIEEILLLLMRMALLALLVLAMAQPMIRNPYFSGIGRTRQDVVLVLDASMSTALESDELSNFQRETRLAGQIIDALRDGDTVRIMLASNVPVWVTPTRQYITGQGRARLHKQLSELSPTRGGLDMVRCLDEALLAFRDDKLARGRIVVLTDGQRQGWDVQAGGRWDYLARSLGEMPARPEIRIVVAGQIPDRFSNAAIAEVRAARNIIGLERPATFMVTVGNTGTEPLASRTLAWSLDGHPEGQAGVPALLPGQTATISVTQQFRAGPSAMMEFRLTDRDDLPADDVWNHAVQVLGGLEALIVDGDPLPGPLAAESAYLRVALSPDDPKDRRGALVRAKVVTAEDFAKTRLADYDAVILANVPKLPEPLVEPLEEYVREGGGLLVAPGDRVNLSFYQSALFAEGAGLLPMLLNEPVGDAAKRDAYEQIALPSGDHPAMQLLADAEKLDLPETRIYRRFAVNRPQLPKGSAVLISTGGGDVLAAEKAYGKGRVIATAFPLDVAWSNLPLRSAFVVMVHEWLYYLADPLMTRWNVRPGEPLVVSLPAERAGPRATVYDPSGGNHAVPGRVEGGRIVYRFAGTDAPGEYRFAIPAGRAATTQADAGGAWKFCVLPDSDESQFRPLSPEALDQLGRRLGAAADQSPKELLLGLTAQGPGRGIWQWLAMGVLAMLVLEIWLTRHMSARRSAA